VRTGVAIAAPTAAVYVPHSSRIMRRTHIYNAKTCNMRHSALIMPLATCRQSVHHAMRSMHSASYSCCCNTAATIDGPARPGLDVSAVRLWGGTGLGVYTDRLKAVACYLKSAESGCAEAQNNLCAPSLPCRECPAEPMY
jgi:hypothetical protein